MRLAISNVCVLASRLGDSSLGTRNRHHQSWKDVLTATQEAQPTPAPACSTSSLLPSKPTAPGSLVHPGSPARGTWAWGHGCQRGCPSGERPRGQGSPGQ